LAVRGRREKGWLGGRKMRNRGLYDIAQSISEKIGSDL